jgi:hypothetical protein
MGREPAVLRSSSSWRRRQRSPRCAAGAVDSSVLLEPVPPGRSTAGAVSQENQVASALDPAMDGPQSFWAFVHGGKLVHQIRSPVATGHLKDGTEFQITNN